MKRLVTALLALLLGLSLMGCGRISTSMEITCDTSQRYSTTDIHDAMDVVKNVFRRHFDGCTMTAIGYIGDEKQKMMEEYAEAVPVQLEKIFTEKQKLEQEKQADKETVIRYKEMLQQTHAPGV